MLFPGLGKASSATPFEAVALVLVLRRGFLRLFMAFSLLAGVFIIYMGSKCLAR